LLLKDILEYRFQKIVVAPLNWGLGHATRCIPIVKHLLENENEVSIASDGEALSLLKKEFPKLKFFTLPSYNITYVHNSMLLNMAGQAKGILKAIRNENSKANEISKKWQADIIISDNRLGFYTDGVENVYITHQLTIPGPNKFISAVATKLHKTFINKYDRCLVPDNEGELALAKDLSNTALKIPKFYLGPLSRFVVEKKPIKYKYTAILSGPEPQRTKMESDIIQVFNKNSSMPLCIVRGSATYRSLQKPESHISMFNLLGSEKLNSIINESEIIICRSGYSSVMDMVALNKKAIILPTPGQYEQIYLAKNLNGKYGFQSVVSVKDISL